jgi:hypothetical protein
MSRCVLDSKNFEVVIGWDPPLGTFFAYVLDKRIDGEDFEKQVFWKGAGERIYRQPDELIEAIQAVRGPPRPRGTSQRVDEGQTYK